MDGRKKACVAECSQRWGRPPLLFQRFVGEWLHKPVEGERGVERFTATKMKSKGVIIAKNGGTVLESRG